VSKKTRNVWESEETWQHFQAERLAPAIAALGAPARPEPTLRDLRPTHVVVGARPGIVDLEKEE
jgi:hypothetical protein